jgi:formylglycine-generating enzyme required for sulfatase activity
MEWVKIPDGVLKMGSTMEQVERCVVYWGSKLINKNYDVATFRRWILKEYPQHLVQVKAFHIGKFPITNYEYEIFITETRHSLPESIITNEPSNHPVWGVSFEDAMVYAKWLGARLGRICRLPTEEEWEYAARGSSTREYPFGDKFDSSLCNVIESDVGHTTAVDHYPNGVSEFGVFDLAGNVEEWTMDYYRPYPGGTFIHDELSKYHGTQYHVLRGGSFTRGGDLARCARRHGLYTGPEFKYTGFRIVIPTEYRSENLQSQDNLFGGN